ncbi:MAG: hypothetical protein ACI85O_001050 [Saprospiraceae bacterium]|jgi:hypothetical protein
MKEIFVTYRWEGKDHSNNVIGFVNYLRENGYAAEMDQMLSQEQTSIDFVKMMHKGMTDYKKIIVVLSKDYKKRADNFKGGVGTEYGLIIKDIEDNPQKYILVSFNGISDEITPLNFKGREIIDLNEPENYNRLHSKIQDKRQITFSEVGAEKPKISSVKIPARQPVQETTKIEILDIDAEFDHSSLYGQQLKQIEFNLPIIIKNSGTKSINELSIEAEMPRLLTEVGSVERRKGENIVYGFNFEKKLFPDQEVIVGTVKLRIMYLHVDFAEVSNLVVTVFSDAGVVKREFPIFDLTHISSYGEERKLKKSDFLAS